MHLQVADIDRGLKHSARYFHSIVAVAIESESLECKPWDPDSRRLKDQLRDVREAVVCLANARGGAIVLGIQDRKRSRKEAIVGVGTLQADTLRKAIYDGTDPHILVD